MKLNGQREQMQKFRLFFNCLKTGNQSEDSNMGACGVPNCGKIQRPQIQRLEGAFKDGRHAILQLREIQENGVN